MRAMIPIADGSEDIEAVTLIDVLRRGGVDVTVASVHERRLVTAARGTRIEADRLLVQCLDEDFDLIALPGGMPGAAHLSDSEALIRRLQQQQQQGHWIAAICAAPGVVLAEHGLLEGLTATAHPAFRERLPDQSRVQEPVVVDSHCITSQGPGTALPFALTLLEQLGGRGLRDKVAAPMCLMH
ncbi:MAG: DJ-1/PfpI family protein [Oleiphilaceae bacterium]|nr:DJ-1/PfpI family protein [Oleiphilaceae bacterium]